MKHILTSALLALVCAAAARADVPTTLNYQGRMLDASGEPIEGPVAVAVAVFDAETDGVMIFTQELAGVVAQDGLYSFEWGGAGLTDALTNNACWLQLHVDGEILAPRQRLVSVPYAVMASEIPDGSVTAEKLAPGVCGGYQPLRMKVQSAVGINMSGSDWLPLAAIVATNNGDAGQARLAFNGTLAFGTGAAGCTLHLRFLWNGGTVHAATHLSSPDLQSWEYDSVSMETFVDFTSGVHTGAVEYWCNCGTPASFGDRVFLFEY